MPNHKNKKILSSLLICTFMLSNFVMFSPIKLAGAETTNTSNLLNTTTGSAVNVTTSQAINVTTRAATSLDIVEITDFHGQLLDTTGTKEVGAVLAKAVEGVSASNPNTLIIGGGDLYQGTPVSNMLKGIPVQKVLSKMGMEVTTLGNHEFDWGLDTINNETMKDASYEIVCSNLYDKTTGKREYEPYKIVNKNGTKIAVIGAILNDVATIVLPANIANYQVNDIATEVNACAKEIRDNNEADVVLAVVHDGGSSLNSMVGNLHGVDAVFGGHTHTSGDDVVKDKDSKDVPVLNASSSGKGYIDLKISLDENKKITNFSAPKTNWKALSTPTTPLDTECKEIADTAYAGLAPIFDEIIGNDAVPYTRTQTDSPYGESQLGNWMSDVVRNNVKADVGIVNNGGIRIDTPAGNITVGTIFGIMPFDNTVTTVKMTGAQLKTIIEQGVVDDGKGLQISGVKITYDSSKTAYREAVTDGERVVSMVRESNGTPIKSDEMLTVAAPDFLATGGDTFTRFLDESIAKTYNDTHTLVRDALIENVRANKAIVVNMDQRLKNQSQSSSGTDSAKEMTIKEAKVAAAQKASAIITGFVSGINGKNVFLQDDPTNPTAGIVLYNTCGADVSKGDKITTTGKLSVYNGLIEITPGTKTDVVKISSNNTITPKEVTIKDINDDLQGELIKVKKVTFISINNTDTSTIQDSTGNIVIFKMPTISGLNVNDVKDVTANVSKYGTTLELILRDQNDVVNPNENSSSSKTTISIVATSDLHGNVLNFDYGTNKAPSKGQGLAKVSTYVNNLRASNPNVMLVDNGDTIQGTPLVYYYNMIDKTSEYPMAKVMGAMKYDTETLGNHEFNFGLDTLNRVIKDDKNGGIHVLSANTYKNDNSNFVDPYYIKEFNINGNVLKVGILGLTTKCVPNWEDPEHYKGLHFNDLVEEAKKWVPIVKQNGADVVIVAAHSGEEGASDVIPENEIKALANNVSGIDAIIAGHAHSVLNDLNLKNPAGKVVPVVEPGKWANYLSQIDINIGDNKAVSIATKNVAMDNTIAEDQNIVSLIAPYQEKTLQYTSTVIGQGTDVFSGEGQTKAPTAIMELINKVQAQSANAQLSIAAPLSATANIPKGDITNKDIMGTYVYENYLYGVKMNGEQIKKWLEYSVRYYKQVSNETEPIEKDAALNIPDYNLDQLYGASYDVDLTKTVGSRIVNLKYNGKPISNTDVFTVAINDYRYNGGGGFMKEAGISNTDPSIVTYSSAKALGDDGQVRSLMISYIKSNKTISPTCSNNWNLSTKNVVVDNSGTKSPATISIVATSDVHGNVLNFDYGVNGAPSKGQGLAKVSTYVNNLRGSNSNVMLVDNGDTIQGTPLVYYYNMIDKTSEYPMAKVMGAMKYDTETLGNHEFNFGLDTLNRVIADEKNGGIHVLSANTYKSDNSNFVEPYYIKEFSINGNTVKVGILGLTTKCIPNWEDPEHYKGLHFNDLVEDAKKWVPIVKQNGADVVIVAAHSGEEGASDVIPENEIKALANSVSGIDAIIAGHAHSVLNDLNLKNPEGKIVPVVEPGKWANYISQIDINLDSNNAVTGLSTKNVIMDKTIDEDPNIVSIIKPYQEKTLQYTSTVIGQGTDVFSGEGQTKAPTAIMELINKVQAQSANAQLSIAAPLSATANIPKGDITIKDIMGTYVYENYLYGVKMNGEQLKKWLEYSVRYYKQVSKETDPIEKDPILNIADYNLDQLYGASYDVDLTKPVGSRIVNLKYNGKSIDNTDVFTVAINDYRYNGGGGFMKEAGISNTDPSVVTYSSAKALGDDGQVRSLMISYIKSSKAISPTCSNNWNLSTKNVVVDNTATSSSSHSHKHTSSSSSNDANNSSAEINTKDSSVSQANKTVEEVVKANIIAKVVGEGSTIEEPKQITNADGNKLIVAKVSKDGSYIGSVITAEKDSAAATIPLSSTKGEIKVVYKYVPLLDKYIQLTEGVTIGADNIILPTQANATYYATAVPMTSTETVAQGWAKVANSWYLINAKGDPNTGWQKDNTGWVYLSPSNGVMQTGWNKQENTWYHLNESGYMSIGWIKTNGKWYYLNTDGSMASNTTTVDGYTLGSNGEWIA